jgi:hypothetical protein
MADLLTNLAAVAGAAGGDGAYIEDVFSTYLYTGTGASLPIVNGIDLDAEGGLVWSKRRNGVAQNKWYDSARGITFAIESDNTGANQTEVTGITSFNSNGYTYGADGNTNSSGDTYVSWTFRKAPKFFDILTYTGTGVNRTVAHNLGSVPGCIMVKRTDTTGDWQVYHRANTANPETDYLVLNSTAATADSNTRWNDTLPTDSVFTVGTEATVNASGGTYVAYLWAHDAGGFGDDGEQNVITCGSYTGNGSTTGPVVTLGYEPQWLLLKAASAPGDDWLLVDNMRGFNVSDTTAHLSPNTSAQEFTTDAIQPTATGFKLVKTYGAWNSNGVTYIYIAIRRGPMKTPEAGTEVFEPVAYTGNGTADRRIDTGIVSDMVFWKSRSNGTDWKSASILAGKERALTPNTTGAEGAVSGYYITDYDNEGFNFGTSDSSYNTSSWTYVTHAFRRAPGFFDVVCYTGTGSATTISHNLGVAPEMMIVKSRSNAIEWAVYHVSLGNDAYVNLDKTSSEQPDVAGDYWNLTTPTNAVFSVGTSTRVNASTYTYIAYLFATLAGVSEVGTYTGNGTSVSVTTGFQPRFILVKRTDSTGNWIVGDSARGLVAGDDPFLLLNSTAVEVTNQDWVDVSATGFTINETAANANVNTGTYIYLAIS